MPKYRYRYRYGQILFHDSFGFAEMERGIIKERINLGLFRAKKERKKLGRPLVQGI